MDQSKQGLLSKADFAKFNGGSLTTTFINRLFQEYATQSGSMDYKMFVDFLLAYENKNTPEAIHYFWRIVNVNKQGYITPFVINLFFRVRRQGSFVNANI